MSHIKSCVIGNRLFVTFHLSLDIISKSACRRACTLGRAWRGFRYKDIAYSLKSEHKCTLLRLPRTMLSTVIFPYFIRPIEMTANNGAWYASAGKELKGPIHVCAKEKLVRPYV
jgi:hypothetical protein